MAFNKTLGMLGIFPKNLRKHLHRMGHKKYSRTEFKTKQEIIKTAIRNTTIHILREDKMRKLENERKRNRNDLEGMT